MPTLSVGRVSRARTLGALGLVVVLLRCDRPAGDPARAVTARTQVHTFMGALGIYKLDTGRFPTTEEGMQALRVRPPGVTGWNGPYLEQDVPKDPWGHEYLYKYPGDHGDAPDIICLGADDAPGGDGINADIVSWDKR